VYVARRTHRKPAQCNARASRTTVILCSSRACNVYTTREKTEKSFLKIIPPVDYYKCRRRRRRPQKRARVRCARCTFAERADWPAYTCVCVCVWKSGRKKNRSRELYARALARSRVAVRTFARVVHDRFFAFFPYVVRMCIFDTIYPADDETFDFSCPDERRSSRPRRYDAHVPQVIQIRGVPDQQ